MQLQILKKSKDWICSCKYLKIIGLSCKYLKIKGLNIHLQMYKDHRTEYVVATT